MTSSLNKSSPRKNKAFRYKKKKNTNNLKTNDKQVMLNRSLQRSSSYQEHITSKQDGFMCMQKIETKQNTQLGAYSTQAVKNHINSTQHAECGQTDTSGEKEELTYCRTAPNTSSQISPEL